VDYKFISTCDGNPVVMSMNYMDNTNDNMQYMFTNGQKRRLQATLLPNGIRYKLVQNGKTQCTNGNGNAAPLVQQLATTKPPVPQQTNISYRIYPNPAQDNINFDIGVEKSGNATLTVFNAQGSLQMSQKYQVSEGSQSFSINCSKWTTGLYFVHLTINDTVVTEQVLINR
jgi:Secretion system C-terminal sorting domain